MQKISAFVIMLFVTAVAIGQPTQEKLERRKAQLQQEIREKERLLQEVRSKEQSVAEQLNLQSQKIKLKQNLISTTERQKHLLDDDIYKNQLTINRLKKELVVLKEDYAEMILKSYKSRSERSRAMFLLSSQNFLQAYKRAQYMKQYASYRRTQGEEIQQKTQQLSATTDVMMVQKDQKKKLIAENEREKQLLEKEKQEQQEIQKALKKNKTQIAAEIKKKQQESKNIDRQIDRLIRDAITAANKKTAAAVAKASPNTTTPARTKEVETASKIVLTAEGKIVADNFRANKGKLPWPVEKGFVSLSYGDQAHPVYKSLVVHNSGVEITTDQGANARAVFGGEVIKVIVLSPVNKAVMIQHGDYFTIYQNLSSVSVSKGDKVNIKENIGKIRTSGDTGKTVLKFMISQNTTYNNPADWLFNM